MTEGAYNGFFTATASVASACWLIAFVIFGFFLSGALPDIPPARPNRFGIYLCIAGTNAYFVSIMLASLSHLLPAVSRPIVSNTALVGEVIIWIGALAIALHPRGSPSGKWKGSIGRQLIALFALGLSIGVTYFSYSSDQALAILAVTIELVLAFALPTTLFLFIVIERERSGP